MYRAKVNFLWFKAREKVEEIQDNWKPYFEKVGKKEVSEFVEEAKPVKKKVAKKKVAKKEE